jgi:hypothetical protein
LPQGLFAAALQSLFTHAVVGVGQGAEGIDDPGRLVVDAAGIGPVGGALFALAHRPKAHEIEPVAVDGERRIVAGPDFARDDPGAAVKRPQPSVESAGISEDGETRAEFPSAPRPSTASR